MMRLQFALWRRDVASRKLVSFRKRKNAGIWYACDRRKEMRLEQRRDRWETIAGSLIERSET